MEFLFSHFAPYPTIKLEQILSKYKTHKIDSGTVAFFTASRITTMSPISFKAGAINLVATGYFSSFPKCVTMAQIVSACKRASFQCSVEFVFIDPCIKVGNAVINVFFEVISYFGSGAIGVQICKI